MNKYCLLLSALLLSAVAHAGDKPLDLDVDPSSSYQVESGGSSWYRDDAYRSPDEEQSDHCRELADQLIELKDRPQRKSAVQQQYNVECAKKNMGSRSSGDMLRRLGD